MKRRTFLHRIAAALGIIVVGTIHSCKKKEIKPQQVNFDLDLQSSGAAPLKQVGGSVIQDNTIIVRTSQGYVAFSDLCTHAGCGVTFDSKSNTFICPCHDGLFDLNGNVMDGPPQYNLPQFKTSLNGNTLHVSSQ